MYIEVGFGENYYIYFELVEGVVENYIFYSKEGGLSKIIVLDSKVRFSIECRFYLTQFYLRYTVYVGEK